MAGGASDDLAAQLVDDFAEGLVAADAKLPQASGRTATYQPGIGPFSEAAAVKLIMAELSQRWPERYGQYDVNVAYPELTRQRCDL